jgi:DNA-binding transcriptional LysR family regulator
LALWQGIRRPIEELRSIAIASEFEPAATHRIFNIAVTDTLLSRVVPVLSARFVAEAPLAKLNFHFHSNPRSMEGLEKGGLDCAVGMFPNISQNLIVEGLADDDYVCVFRGDHPLLEAGVSLEQFLAAKHILVKQALGQIGIVDAWMGLQGMQRDIVVTVNTAAEALSVAMGSDLVAAVPRSYVLSADKAARLAWAPLPFPHDPILYKMAWHDRTDREPAAIWLRNMVKDSVKSAFEALPVAEAHREAPRMVKRRLRTA